jgi:YYY domain-containing protein
VLFDWLAREGWIVFNWWLLATLAGATALPIMVRLLGALPDRGYTLARPAGILLIAFTFWLLGTLGFLRNSSGSILLAWLMVALAAAIVYFRSGEPINWRAWWTENRPLVIVTEVLFVVLLLGWSIYRAHQNNLDGTEKPMDLAFMSAALQSEQYPPQDPWLSGYSISYYYFGYVMAAMFSSLSGVWTSTGYNMHIAMLFALVSIGSFGLAYNLARSRSFRHRESALTAVDKGPSRAAALWTGALGMIFVVWLSNFQFPLVELPYQTGLADADYLAVYNLDQREQPIADDRASVSVNDWVNWWWFRAARALSDRDLNNNHIEVINEFPMFSFVLADSHPHVMALPYALLAIGLALNVILSPRQPTSTQVLFYGLCIGGLVFLNTWDNPIYLMVLVGAEALRRMIRAGQLAAQDWFELFLLGGALLLITLVAYAPFIINFRSQLGGAMPNLIHPTRFSQFVLAFGPFILLLSLFLAVEAWRAGRDGLMRWSWGVTVALMIVVALIAGLLLFVLVGLVSDEVSNTAQSFINANGGLSRVLPDIVNRHLIALPTAIVLLAGIALVVARLFPRPAVDMDDADTDPERAPSNITYPAATGFALMLIGAGLLLVLIPEFVYLRDNFGSRMNTVFKFYYQAWVMFGLAAAYGTYTILGDVRLSRPAPALRIGYSVILALVLIMGLPYAPLAIYSRAWVEIGRDAGSRPALTLDGGRTLVRGDDYDAIMCLMSLVDDGDTVIAETGPENAYASYDFGASGRTGALTGFSSVLGWTGHQRQWRGAGYEAAVGTRLDDLRQLYGDLRWDAVTPILERYGIDYIVVGEVERSRYGAQGETKFMENLDVVCGADSATRIYRVDDQATVNR